MLKEKFFKKYIANFIIICVLVIVSVMAFSSESVQTANVQSLRAFYNGGNECTEISLMVNVYTGETYVQKMLDIAKEENIKLTFFVGGLWVEKNVELLKTISDLGHEIGNHGYMHKDSDKLTSERLKEEILSNHKLVKSIINKDMTLFAPPSGAYSEQNLQVIDSLGYKTIMWSKDTIDWRDQNSSLIYERATKNACNGDFILMHPTASTVECLQKIIVFLKSENFQIVTVSENLKNCEDFCM